MCFEAWYGVVLLAVPVVLALAIARADYAERQR